jgi:protein DGCR14
VEEKIVINGYEMMDLPDPSPGRDTSPIMTWGQIEDTPMRLDDTRNYKIPSQNDREVLADDLVMKYQNSKISVKKKNKRKLTDIIKSVTPSMSRHNSQLHTGSKLVQELIRRSKIIYAK